MNRPVGIDHSIINVFRLVARRDTWGALHALGRLAGWSPAEIQSEWDREEKCLKSLGVGTKDSPTKAAEKVEPSEPQGSTESLEAA